MTGLIDTFFNLQVMLQYLPKVLEGMFHFWDTVNLEDIQICENVQVGTSSTPYTGGRFSFRFEETIHRFQNMVVDKAESLHSERTSYS